MSIKQKYSKQHKTVKDRENNRQTLIIIALVTVGLMALMYFAFAR